MRTPLIELEDIHFGYGDHTVLNGVDLSLYEGDRVGVVGPIGSGKTTLLHLMVGLLKPSSGRIRAFGKIRGEEPDFHEVRARAGLVFQDPDDQLFCPTVLEDVAFGPLNLGKSVEEAKRTSHDVLDRVGLKGFANRITYKLSGGEKRLVALATVLAMDPHVLLLDEPTASLDQESVDRLVRTLNDLPQSMLIVSHERDFLPRVSTRCVTLKEGRVFTTG
jgi:cobalt/nickel transport system ATP-binding protein